MPHVPWPSIENFAHARRALAARGTLRVYAKVKLHGTNGAVRIDPDGTVTCQSRNNDVTGEYGHFGMASWVAEHAEAFRGLNTPGVHTTILYGEWAGPGISQGDACSRIPERTFFVFSLAQSFNDRPDEFVHFASDRFIRDELANAGPAGYNFGGRLRVLPWTTENAYPVNFADPLDTEQFLADVDAQVTAIGEEDPYVKNEYGVSGPGEGLVFYDRHTCLPIFKAKVDGHGKGAKGPRPTKVPRDIQRVANAQDFATLAVSEGRLLQGASEVHGEDGTYTRARTGDFVRWVNADVAKECAQELAAAGLAWCDVATAVQKRASAWYLAQVAAL